MEKRNIYVEHNGEWYDYSHCAGQFPLDTYIKSAKAPDAGNVRTDKREFEIGSLVKFENLEDWTEVVESFMCDGCVQDTNRGSCDVLLRCSPSDRGDEKSIVFKKYTTETTEKSEEPSAPTEGLKFDSGKLHPRLFPMECFEAICKVLTFGEGKYSADNWKKVAPEKYIDAMWRHWIAWQTGEERDSESGLSHAAHFATNAVFLLYFEIENQKSEAGK